MNQQRKTQYRPEQLRYYKFLNDRTDNDLALEYVVPKLVKIDEIEPKTVIADIADLTTKVIYRLNGPIHEGRLHVMKDEDQKVVLEGNGWIVIDIWYYDYTSLFNNNDDWIEECENKYVRIFSLSDEKK